MNSNAVALLLADQSPASSELVEALSARGALRVEHRGSLQSAPAPGAYQFIVVAPSAYETTSPGALMQTPEDTVVLVAATRQHLLDAIRFTYRADSYCFLDEHMHVLASVLRLSRAGYCVVPSYIPPNFALDDLRLPLLRNLTGSEIAVLRHLRQGLSNAVIAQRLEVPEVTVKTLVRSLLTKLRLRNRTEAGVFALRHASEIESVRRSLESSQH